MRERATTNIVEYLGTLSAENRAKMESLMRLVEELCPDAQAGFSYGMPAYKYLSKPLIYFSVFTHHLGVYATPVTHEYFKNQLGSYKTGKGSVQFPLDQELPLGLIREMIRFRMAILKDGNK